MKNRILSALLLGAGLSCAQVAVDLDQVEAPAPSRRGGEGVQVGGLKLNLYFDAGVSWTKEANSTDKADFRFLQQHASLLGRATTSDDIDVQVDILHPTDVFEATIPLRFFSPSLKTIPVIGGAAIRGGRIIVPFGDFEDHPIYGGAVNNSRQIREVIWSDYGMCLHVPMGPVKTEWYAVNGIKKTDDSTVYFTSAEESNQLKGFGARAKWTPMSTLFVTGSYYHDFIPFDDSLMDASMDRAVLAGLDMGWTTGDFAFRLGGVKGWVQSRKYTDYSKSGWYAEGKWNLNETWALRMRGGQVDPDSRFVEDYDQTNVNVSAIWNKGPVDVRFTYFRNFETHWPSSKWRPENKNRLFLETFVSI
jgi:hypothetical protein